MKFQILILILIPSLAFAGGTVSGEAGGSDEEKVVVTPTKRGETEITRGPASVEEDYETRVMDEAKKNNGNACLKMLGSTNVFDHYSDAIKLKVKEEIIQRVAALKKENISIDSFNKPECLTYANDNDDESLKSLFKKFKAPRTPASGKKVITPPQSNISR